MSEENRETVKETIAFLGHEECTTDELFKKLALINKEYTDVKVEVEMDYDGYPDLILTGVRPETDEEMNRRIRIARNAARRKEKADKVLYERLKRKFGEKDK